MSIHRVTYWASIACLCLLIQIVRAEDWPQWRGPGRCGVSTETVALADSWPKGGPKQLWKSELIPSQGNGGFACPVVAGDRVYTYANWKHLDPTPVRKLSADVLKTLGWLAEAMPKELGEKLEAARLSDERAKLKGRELRTWIEQWIATNLNEGRSTTAPATKPTALTQKFGGYAQTRLVKGRDALSVDQFGKLSAARDKEFPDQAALEKWLDDNGLEDANAKKLIVAAIPVTTERFVDTIFCFDAAKGTTVWKKEFPGRGYEWASSSTPCIAGGRLYVAGADSKAYCLDAKDGTLIWEAKTKAKPASRICSSFIVVDDLAIVLADVLTALKTSDGSIAWTQDKVTGQDNSPVAWKAEDKMYLLCNSNKGLACVEAASGQLLWTVPGGGWSSVAVDGDVAVVMSTSKAVGVTAYRITPLKAEKMWTYDCTDRGASPLIHGGLVYITGGGRIACLGMDGTEKWQTKMGGEISSPVVADGKIIANIDGGANLVMFRATAEKYNLLGSGAKLGITPCVSPVVSAGKLYLRLGDGLACYDLMP